MYSLISKEKNRQFSSIQLIASENVANSNVRECLGSILTNKYSEGYPGNRYYGGNDIIDEIENLAIKRALEAFNLDSSVWGVNVQPYSGSCANLGVYLGLLNPHDRIMGLSLPSGGHLTHGHYTTKKNISSSSVLYNSLAYNVDPVSNLLDYNNLSKLATSFKPHLLICGYSAYSRDLDYKQFRQIADLNNSYLMCDMAHYSGFVASGHFNSPFDYCDVVTSTTHKTLGGPRAGMIFYKLDLKSKIDFGIFPMLQGGPHQNKIAAIAYQMKHVKSFEFKNYISKVQANARCLSTELINYGYDVCTGGTDNHIVLLNLKSENISGDKVESLCNKVNISINKNCVPSDKSALTPSGIRLGSAYMTSLGFDVSDFKKIAYYIHECIQKSKTNYSDVDINRLKKEIDFFIVNTLH